MVSAEEHLMAHLMDALMVKIMIEPMEQCLVVMKEMQTDDHLVTKKVLIKD